MSIWKGVEINLSDTIVGDTIWLIYGDWMRMEGKNGVKPKKPLIQYPCGWPAPTPASMSPPIVQYSTVQDSTIQDSTLQKYKPPKVKLFEESSFEYSISKFFLSNLISRWVSSVIYQLTKKSELDIIYSWAWIVDKMIRIDNLTPDQIKYIVEFTTKDEFWSKTILSMEKFRKKNKEWIPYFVVIIWKIKDSWELKKDTSQMSWDEALEEAKRRWLV